MLLQFNIKCYKICTSMQCSEKIKWKSERNMLLNKLWTKTLHIETSSKHWSKITKLRNSHTHLHCKHICFSKQVILKKFNLYRMLCYGMLWYAFTIKSLMICFETSVLHCIVLVFNVMYDMVQVVKDLLALTVLERV